MTGQATLTVPEVAELLGLSRNAAYAQARKGEIAGVVVISVGRRLLVPAQPLLQLLGIPAAHDVASDRAGYGD